MSSRRMVRGERAPSGRQRPPGAAPSRMLVAWCPDWPVVAAVRQAGMPPDAPAVVLSAARVQVASSSARGWGIRIGMRRREVQYRCPEIAVFGAEPDRDARAFEPVAAAVEEVVPAVEVLRPGLLACPVRGPARYFGSEEAAAERLVDQIEALDVECRIGIADGLATAVLAARQARLVAAGADAAFCAGLPLIELAREPALAAPSWRELADVLQRLGIDSAGALAALPQDKVVARFGADGLDMQRLAAGRADRGLSRRGIDAELAEEQECDPPLQRVDTAAFLAKGLAQRFHARLAAAGLACTRLAITASTDSGESLSRVWRCTRPLTADGTADRLRWQLDGWLTATSGRANRATTITALRLDAIEAVDAGRIQYGLWGADGLGEHRAGAAFARVQGLLGVDAVRTAIRAGGRGPADRIVTAAWGEPLRPERAVTGPWPGALPSPAPTRLGQAIPAQRPAGPGGSVGVRVEMRDQHGARSDLTERGLLTGRPATLDGRRVVAWAGPWLLDEQWWAEAAGNAGAAGNAENAGNVDRPTVRRARMQVVTESGPPVLLELGADGWRVEAVYD